MHPPVAPSSSLSLVVLAGLVSACGEPAGGADGASAVPQASRVCASIHAVLIAKAEGLPDCDAAAIASPPRTATASGCGRLTANACAEEHYASAEAYTRAAGTGSFELHYLAAATGLRCADGTRPHYYYSPGADDTRWIVYQNGSSGKCRRRRTRTGSYEEAGQDCLAYFASGAGNSGFGQKQRWEGGGIMDGGARNADFRDWNRVWVPSCSNDQYQGSVDHPAELVLAEPAAEWSAPLYSRGFDIINAVVDDVAAGAVARDLSNATLVMLYGTSGGAGGLQMTLDAKAAHVAAVSPARVVGLLDSRSEPNLAGAEGLFDGSRCASIFAADCPTNYDVPPVGTDVGAGFAFDATAYDPETSCVGCGSSRLTTEWWGDNLDASCVARHGGTAAPCYDGYHVVYEHTATPVFQATSLRDHNQYDNPLEYVSVAEGDQVTFQGLESMQPWCGALPRERVGKQLVAYAAFRDAVGGGAHGDAHGAGPIGIWAIDWADHEITKEAGIFNDAALDGVTLSAAILDWAVNGKAVQLIEAPGLAVQTAAPTIPQKVNKCP